MTMNKVEIFTWILLSCLNSSNLEFTRCYNICSVIVSDIYFL
jgi:hypothetical protein